MPSAIRVGPARLPSRESPEAAVELLLQAGYAACEIDFESGFWMDYPFAERLGELARQHDVALSVHAPLFAFPGHPDEKKAKQALSEKEKARREIAERMATQRALRLAKEAADREAAEKADAEKAAAKTKKPSHSPKAERRQS